MFRRSTLPLLGVPLESRITRLAFISPERFVALEDLRKILVCFDLKGRRIWERSVKSAYPSPSRIVVAHGCIWLDCRDHIARFDLDGNEIEPFRFELRPREEVGWFVVGADSVGVSLYLDILQPPALFPPGERQDISGRAMRLNLDGTPRWSCRLPVANLAYAGITRATPNWPPTSWKCDCYANNALLLSGDTLLASFIDISGGIGFSYAVRWSDGLLLWTTEMAPFDYRAICGEGEFAFSVGGYGASRTFVLNAQGETVHEWKGNGILCASENGDLWLAEKANYVGKPCSVWQLKATGEAHKRADIVSGSSSFHALSQNGIIFWRDGKLWGVGFDGTTFVLNANVGPPKSCVLSRMMLNGEGTLVFATAGTGSPSDEHITPMLWIAQEKVAPLMESPWPCVDGNSQGNPVWREKR